MTEYSVGITGLGSYLPERIVTNYDFEKILDTSNEWIVKRTGIEERRIADPEIATSDLGYQAAKRALEDANLQAEDLDLILVATITPDYIFPATACLVQEKLGAKNAAAFDINAACTGFIYGIMTGAGYIKSGIYEKVLVIGSEALSKVTDLEDRSTAVLFGDGAGACVLERCQEGYGILAHHMGSDAKKHKVLYQPAGGSKIPASVETVQDRLHFLKMDGREVFKFAVRAMESSSLAVLEESDMNLEDLDFLIPHQANIRIIDSARKRLKLPWEKTYVNLNKYGNMSSASVPVALDEAVSSGKIKKGDRVLLVAFGAGLTWGSIMLRWGKEEVDA